jgi:hypothetical protein
MIIYPPLDYRAGTTIGNCLEKKSSVTRSKSDVTSILSASPQVGRNAPALRAAPATLRVGVATLGGLFFTHP